MPLVGRRRSSAVAAPPPARAPPIAVESSESNLPVRYERPPVQLSDDDEDYDLLDEMTGPMSPHTENSPRSRYGAEWAYNHHLPHSSHLKCPWPSRNRRSLAPQREAQVQETSRQREVP